MTSYRMRVTLLFLMVIFGAGAFANEARQKSTVRTYPVLADAEALKAVGAPILAQEDKTGVAFSFIHSGQEEELRHIAHERGACGGFELLPESINNSQSLALHSIFSDLAARKKKDDDWNSTPVFKGVLSPQPKITKALAEVSTDSLRETVEFMSSFQTRFHRSGDANTPILALKARIEATLKNATIPFQINLVDHKSTRQKSIHLSFPGKSRTGEIVVIGGHADSINRDSANPSAPGADDNASGSSVILEAARILSTQEQPERTLDFFWYAGEEGGLLGSSEIAADYKNQGRDVIGVAQFDMTMHPGSGENVIASIGDYTSAWLRGYLENLNSTYIGVRILNDRCGYACSDHASWYRRGFPSMMPAQAAFRRTNPLLHTDRDRINSSSSFQHMAIFAKIAVAFALDLGNSQEREP